MIENCAQLIIVQGKQILKTDKCIHLDKYYYRKDPSGHFRSGAHCGHGSAHIQITNKKDRVTCPNCIDMFPENLYR